MSYSFNKSKFKEEILDHVRNFSRKTLEDCSLQELYQAVAFAVRDIITDHWIATQRAYNQKTPKTLYYLSMEFLIGRALGNNLVNMGIMEEVQEVLDELNIKINLAAIEEQEPDAGLGNGGLGRLAACFMDSLSTLSYPAYGCGIRYNYGIFKQKIEDGYQVEYPDDWLKNGNPWEVKRTDNAREIKFGGTVSSFVDERGKIHFVQQDYESVLAIPYDMPIVGYKNGFINALRLWDAEAPDKFILRFFDQGAYQKAVEQQTLAKTLVEVLYPNDNHYQGKELRLKQQYFFVSATLQQAIAKFKKSHSSLYLLPEKVVFQMNDTHPAVAVAELMRILLDEEQLEWDEAFDITTRTCAYTNHTIMIEALESWPIDLFSKLLPRIYQIIEEINRRFCISLREEHHLSENIIHNMSIISDGQIKMAYLAIVGSFSVNGVAAIHTEILKKDVLKNFYNVYPQKFNNKTNGITQRRWLGHANPELAALITHTIGDKWYTDLMELKKLLPYAHDKSFMKEFDDIKFHNKVRLAQYVKEHNGIVLNPHSIYDVQVKRLHEYKRQLMNVLHILMLYNEIKDNPNGNFVPRTFIFGAKAAPGYRKAKLIIKLINAVADKVNNDPLVRKYLTVVFIENYNVSNAEIIIPAANVSEQISTASKEASGTSNMKFMLNGALTVGTLDGANIEIYEEVGPENIFIFGLTCQEVLELYKSGNYSPWDIYHNDSEINRTLKSLINGTLSPDSPDLFVEIYESLINRAGDNLSDPYFILKDLRPYHAAQKLVDKAYLDKEGWIQKAIINTACSGKFSSDRTIKQYSSEIWGLESLKMNKKSY
ncbi:glycogen phosphorylase [Sporanaerobium hydrogeniformans]|uniref:Glycogen phosphorylase n=1 Tax=Sporanaerobium hydrogeniformans TaxID=3072179 RepID=A0AC61DAW3_9FIRM|nr:glycogen/starch/alpha-glucan phosphorylase [Sporanaerobium hydrogeniformans]PHV69883.1 glycogen phosphorylase [Sporanaerobium hydrogeniformans]